MIRYVPSSSAETLSDALWSLAVPLASRGENTTKQLFPWVMDTQGNQWLVVETTYQIKVHPAADMEGIRTILERWIGRGITQLDIDALADLVASKRGQSLTPWEFFPKVFQDLSKSREEIIAAGLLAEPNMSAP